MSAGAMSTDQLLSLNRFVVDEENRHIVLDRAVCRRCPAKPCLLVCPAGLYRLDEEGDMRFDYAGCLECGTCRVMCGSGGIVQWAYPRGMCGVRFRYG